MSDGTETEETRILRATLIKACDELQAAREAMTGARPGVPLRLGDGLHLHGTPEQRIAFFGALAKAQAEYQPISRSRTVQVRSDKGNYTFDYAPLEEVLTATQPALNKHGIAWLCVPTPGELHTMLTHCDGAMLHAVERMPEVSKPQEFGSVLTYKRRYSYQCLTGTSPEYDDDGNEASGNKVEAMQQRRREPPAAPSKPAQAAPAPKAVAAAPKPAPPPQAEPAPAPKPASVPPPDPIVAAVVENMDAEPVQPEEPQGFDPHAPRTQEQYEEIVQLAIAQRLNRDAMTKLVQDRIGVDKTAGNLTVTDANILITLLKARAQ